MPHDSSSEPEVHKPKKQRTFFKSALFKSIVIVVFAIIAAAGILFVLRSRTQVSIDTSQISAPQIDLSPSSAGALDEVYVQNGDTVQPNEVVAKVGDKLIKTKVAGIVIAVQNDIGKTFNPGQAVVSMIDPTQLRVVGIIDENKGLDKIAVGQPVSFTVDAFGSKQYVGVIDEVAQTSNQTGVVFNISDQRATQQFAVKARFNTADYTELKNGMSAKMTIYIR